MVLGTEHLPSERFPSPLNLWAISPDPTPTQFIYLLRPGVTMKPRWPQPCIPLGCLGLQTDATVVAPVVTFII